MKALQTSWNYHRSHHPQLSGKIEKTNGKTRLSRTTLKYMELHELIGWLQFL